MCLRFATVARNQDIWLGSARVLKVGAQCATDARGWDILPGSALRSLMGVKEDLPATSAVGWDISPGSAPVNTVIMVGARTEKVEPRSATSATGF